MPYLVRTDLCTGCSLCMGACPSGAIRLVDGMAHIDPAGCEDCGACVDACPEEAIVSVAPLSLVGVEGRMAREGSVLPLEQTHGLRGLVASAGAALDTLSRALVPHMISILTAALEQRVAGSQASQIRQTPRRLRLPSGRGDCKRRRERERRGGRRI